VGDAAVKPRAEQGSIEVYPPALLPLIAMRAFIQALASEMQGAAATISTSTTPIAINNFVSLHNREPVVDAGSATAAGQNDLYLSAEDPPTSAAD